MSQLKAPFPWFGGKSRVAHIVWQRFGNVANYIEPFFGSGAVLLGRPHTPRIETVNDKDAFIANFWRAVKHDPEAVARWCDWPVNECDLHARHRWLIDIMPEHRERLENEPDYYDAKIAGWWVWGLSQWIGDGWCQISNFGKGGYKQMPNVHGTGAKGVHKKMPNVDGAGAKGVAAIVTIDFGLLCNRLRRVRVCCGDWSRITTNTVLSVGKGVAGVFLDPPYSHDEHNGDRYDEADIAADVAAWAREHGDNPNLRIALCGYEGEHDMPGWDCVAWKAQGGYGNRGGENVNAWRERIWFSPHCPGGQLSLF